MRHIPRRELTMGWRFRMADDTEWQNIALPHSWNALDTMNTDPAEHYRRGVGVYEYDYAPPESGKRHWLELGAVAQRGHVYFDGDLLAEHHGGYTAFTVELPDQPGILRVEADNRPDPDLIPSDMSDFFLYGGITRPVYLYSTGANRLERVLCDLDVSADVGKIGLRGCLHDEPAAALKLEIKLFPPQEVQKPLYEIQHEIGGREFALQLPDILQPLLWSPDTPQLYMLYVRLLDGSTQLDECSIVTGLRWFDFPEGGPFYLNGERLLLRGTHRHDDWAGHGAAVPKKLVEREIEQIKAAGFNFIRLGHYPQDDHTLALLDKMGIIVWEELPWCRGGLGGDSFKQHAHNMLQEMIEQHYNNPSVIFWGLGNELDWESEHPDSSDAKVADFLQELHDRTHKLDPRRLTALRRFEPGATIVDVYSPSIWSGWYRGRYEDYETVLRDAIAQYPRLLHMEWGGDSHVGRHNTGPHITTQIESTTDHGEVPGTATSAEGFARFSRDGDWSESYIIDLMAHHLAVQARLPQLAGTAQWVFKDFGTPLRPENPIPYVNQKGLVARDGTPKDVYHVFRAFQSDEPVVHIESWAVRVVQDEHSDATIRVITNCDTVALSINGMAQPTKKRPDDAPAAVLTWHLPLTIGAHHVKIIGYRAGEICAEQTRTINVVLGNLAPVAGVETTIQADQVVAQLVDADGRPVTHDERQLRFTHETAVLQRHQGTMGGSDVVQTANGRAWIGFTTEVGSGLTNVR